MLSPLQMHLKRLEKKNIVVEEIFKREDKVFVRTLNGDRNDSVYQANKIEKNYYRDGKRLYREKKFDKNITYTMTLSKGDNEFTCSECGYRATEKEFYDGCPYCGASFYLEQGFRQKNLAVAMKQIFSMKKYKAFLGGFCIFFSFWFFMGLVQSGEYPWFIAIMMALSMLPILLAGLHIFFTILLIPYLIVKVITHRDLRNDRITIDGIRMSNQKIIQDLNYQLLVNYYDEKIFPQYQDLVDFEILDYDTYHVVKKGNIPAIRITFEIRKYFENNGHIRKVQGKETVTLLRNQNYYPKVEMNSAKKCPNCGANVGLFDKTCSYCGSVLPSNILWVLDVSQQRKDFSSGKK